jgi:hypothetical protein
LRCIVRRAELLARQAEAILASVQTPRGAAPRVYYGRAPDGLVGSPGAGAAAPDTEILTSPLIALVERAGEVVTQTELISRVFGRTCSLILRAAG